MIAPTITVQSEANFLVRSLGNVVRNLPKELRIVSWKTARKTKSFMAKEVTKELATPQKVVKATLKTDRKEPTGAEVTLRKTSRISLREFKARQTRAGVSYRISKSKGRQTVQGAFTGPKPGLTFVKFRGHVLKRVGKSRLPIRKLYGPSPWGVFAVNKLQTTVTPKVNAELRKQLQERLRYQKLKKSGAI